MIKGVPPAQKGTAGCLLGRREGEQAPTQTGMAARAAAKFLADVSILGAGFFVKLIASIPI